MAKDTTMAINSEKLGYILQNFVTGTTNVQGAAVVTLSILTSCGQDAGFLVLAGKAAKQGVLMLEIKRALTELKPALF
jgi:hypothetical protein